MDRFELPAPVAELSDDQIETLIGTARSFGESVVALGNEAPADQLLEAERIAPIFTSLVAEQTRRAEAAAAQPSAEDRAAALRDAFATATPAAPVAPAVTEPATPAAPVAPVVEPAVELFAEDLVQAASETDSEFAVRQGRYARRTPLAAASEPTEPVEPATPAEPAEPAAPESVVASVAANIGRPAVPASAPARGALAIVASADVAGYSTGQTLNGMTDVAGAFAAKLSGIPTTGGREGTPMAHFPVATFKKEFPKELIVGPKTGSDEAGAIIRHAADERRLAGESLVASGGWCAPSEIVMDMCQNETTEGILSLPEIQVNRGGVNWTAGPDFSAIYSGVGWDLTEAQAISGTDKTCYEVPCPTFTDTRLDAVGICIKSPILTQSAWPELVQRVIEGAMVAHQHKVNAKVLAKMETLLAANTPTTNVLLGGSFADTLAAFELFADSKRAAYRLSVNASMEAVLPHWVRGIFRSDLGHRMGVGTEAITDQMLDAHFAVRKISVQWVYGWQALGATPVAYPTTFKAMIYPAGAFVKGTSDVIKLNAVYDAASLIENMYTALFFEEGVLVLKTCYAGAVITIPTCLQGTVGAADATCVPAA